MTPQACRLQEVPRQAPRVSLSLWLTWPHCLACGILVPWPGIEPRPQQWKHGGLIAVTLRLAKAGVCYSSWLPKCSWQLKYIGSVTREKQTPPYRLSSSYCRVFKNPLEEKHQGTCFTIGYIFLKHQKVVKVSLWPPRTIARQAPLSMKFSRWEYWSGQPCPSPGDLPNPVVEPQLSWIAGSCFTVCATREALSQGGQTQKDLN